MEVCYNIILPSTATYFCQVAPPSGFPPKTRGHFLSPHSCYITRPIHSPWIITFILSCDMHVQNIITPTSYDDRILVVSTCACFLWENTSSDFDPETGHPQGFRGFPQPLQKNDRTVPKIRPRQRPSMSYHSNAQNWVPVTDSVVKQTIDRRPITNYCYKLFSIKIYNRLLVQCHTCPSDPCIPTKYNFISLLVLLLLLSSMHLISTDSCHSVHVHTNAFQGICPSPRPCVIFHKVPVF
jgi:hypothetical protein